MPDVTRALRRPPEPAGEGDTEGEVVDTVILAAGRGSRLEGAAAPFWKPLMVVNGEPLVVTVARQGVTINLGRTIIVVSPENAQPICQVLAHHNLAEAVDIVVQPAPTGPGDAFLRASAFLDGRVMILCADNVIPDWDVQRCKDCLGTLVIGVRLLESVESEEAERFTRITEGGHVEEGPHRRPDAVWNDGKYRVWLGPLVLDAASFQDVLVRRRLDEELKIGANLEGYLDCPAGVKGPTLVPVNCYDIGVPE